MLFCGNQKPDPIDDYLEEFLFDLVELRKDGYKFNVELHFFACDAPARVALKCIVGHTGHNAGELCNIKGNWVLNRLTFDVVDDFEVKTDEGFKNNLYSSHQKKESPLIQRSICCIILFMLDYMHLVCLGVTSRIFNFLRKGPKICPLSHAQLALVSEHLVSLRGNIPSSFARKPRTLFGLDRWKATEFRQFLLYTGPVVLQKVLSKEIFCRFMSLTLAIFILINVDVDAREEMLEYAATLLNFFVDNAHIYYGDTFNVYNVHNMKHIVDNVKHFNFSLDFLLCFKFENYLQSLKRMVKNANNTIVQICKRLHELEATEYRHQEQIKSKFALSTKPRNKYFYFKNGDLGIVESINDLNMDAYVIKKKYLQSYLGELINSKMYSIYKMNAATRRTEIMQLPLNCVHRKGFCLPLDDNAGVIFPLLHRV